ncbi:MAG: hypothetical protein SFX19_04715 [Alphaproteobacteria bacterium]|nr:hypothetical protein [Alphaproteobacteria bacterium]
MSLSSRNKAMLPGVIFLMLVTIFIMRFGAIILILTIIPSIVAFFMDRQPRRPHFKVIAACNISAALPFIVPIIDFSLKKQYSEAGAVMDDPMSWAFIYCGAASGWGMLYLAKFVARAVTLMHYEYAISMLEKKQAILLKEWGEEIGQPDHINKKSNR